MIVQDIVMSPWDSSILEKRRFIKCRSVNGNVWNMHILAIVLIKVKNEMPQKGEVK